MSQMIRLVYLLAIPVYIIIVKGSLINVLKINKNRSITILTGFAIGSLLPVSGVRSPDEATNSRQQFNAFYD